LNKFIVFTLLLSSLGCVAKANPFHPDIQLLNENGMVWREGQPISQTNSCGQCHDTTFILDSLNHHHQTLSDPLTRLNDALGITSNSALKTDIVECLDCHNPKPEQSLGDLADEQSVIASGKLLLTSPTSDNCGTCHSQRWQADEQRPVSLPNLNATADLQALLFGLTGEIFSAQKISESALNIRNKETLNFSFDSHAERVVACTDCHSSQNNPVQPPARAQSKNLRFDPRTLSAHDYLQRPNHEFGRAHSCTACHEPTGHTWLPYREQHFNKLTCESCHSAWIAAPAFAHVAFKPEPTIQWRGIDEQENIVTGYRPWLLPNAHGRLQPYNVIESSDANNRWWQATAIHHNVNKSQATRACSDCHSKNSVLLRSLPGEPANLNLPTGFISAEGKPNLALAGIYVLGGNTLPWVDWLGLLIVLGTLVAVSAHGIARYLASKRHPAKDTPRERVYMYSRYQRLWHWLQAALILALIATGAAVHKPWLFPWVGFDVVVHAHNILGFILFVNAALALFYHLASGEIKQFIPMPDDFFVRSYQQVQFYLKGIFNNEAHPFEKDPQHKLNPLQKIAYFGLLNVLLPAQVLTGLLMWGSQEWPLLAGALGGLTLLGPLHSLLAWAFLAFLIMHIYLTTTSGPKLSSGIESMIVGWEDVEIHQREKKHE